MEKKYGIAEIFTSVQGEGMYTGTRMHFIRFSGCSVGKKLTDEERPKFLAKEEPHWEYLHAQLPVYREKCTLYDGREFLCDTNFQTSKAMSVQEIMDTIPVGVIHICLTGGEPLDRDLSPLLDELKKKGCVVHIETSGTVHISNVSFPADVLKALIDGWVWITVSPKYGVLDEVLDLANEIKLLVDEDFDLERLPSKVHEHSLVWVQPVNREWTIDGENVKRCLKILEQKPQWRISTQMHKIWNVR